MDFKSRLRALNDRQRSAVDQIDGPLMVIAGPGTGKTELLSLRAANILTKTDSLPENILCLTFTDSGAAAMRERLSGIIGPAAYKIAIHTFHSFGTEIINQNREFFYAGAGFRPAGELRRFEILRALFHELDPASPLASKMNGAYTHLSDILTVISELKKSGLSSAELLNVLDTNDEVIDLAESLLLPVFASGVKKGTIDVLLPAVTTLGLMDNHLNIPGLTALSDVLIVSLEQAVAQATADNSTKPITAWKNNWFKKNDRNEYVLKARDRQAKLRHAAIVYDQYITRMREEGLFDFDDMVLNVVHGLEVLPELRFNLQEKYLYVMVDEFQDTNLAQMRILLNLIQSDVNEGRPNIMVVGDDDQAIYGFQGATVGNIHTFLTQFPDAPRIVLTDNYRSTADILQSARKVIIHGTERLENYMPDINKTLIAKQQRVASSGTDLATGPPNANTDVRLIELSSAGSERAWVVENISTRIKNGEPPGSIAVLARRHHELVDLLPYFIEAGIKVNYERRDNVLALDSIGLIRHIADVLVAILEERLEDACALLPELLSHPAFGINPLLVWRLSLEAQSRRESWLEVMPNIAEFKPFHTWLITNAQVASYAPLERMCDIIIGTPGLTQNDDQTYVSPLYNYFFSPSKLESEPDLYLTHLEGLITIRSRLRDYSSETTPTIRTLLDFMNLQLESGTTITSIRPVRNQASDAVNLMTAHKSKGLEFDSVYIVGAVDSAWGERVRTKSRLIAYPENLPLMPPGDSPDDRLRLFYVAMTRAKSNLTISYSTSDDSGKTMLPASFLSGDAWQPETPPEADTTTEHIRAAKLHWYQPLVRPLSPPMRELLAPKLEGYKLSATHLNNFLDVTQGGPQAFLLNDLLKFPSAVSPGAGYGRAVHSALQRAHAHLSATGEPRPSEDIVKDFETALHEQQLYPTQFEHYLQRGSVALRAFLDAKYADFSPRQKSELNFGGQGVVIGEAKLTGILDVVDITKNSLIVTDYKTGKAARSWQGSGEYEKIKLHRYRTQLMFYELLIRNSRDYSKYRVDNAIIQFVEPTPLGDILSLESSFNDEECERTARLIQAVWQRIITLDLPNTDMFTTDYKGILAFEEFMLDNS